MLAEEAESRLCPADSEKGDDVVGELLEFVNSISGMGEYHRTYRNECSQLVRRLRLLVPLLEEIRDFDGALTGSVHSRLRDMKEVLLLGKILLHRCTQGSKIYMVLENESTFDKFNNVNDGLLQCLNGFPYQDLEISDEVREQVELMNAQIGRARRSTCIKDAELGRDILDVFSDDCGRKNDRARLVERLAEKLELCTAEELSAEAASVGRLGGEAGGRGPETFGRVVYLLNELNHAMGVEEFTVQGNEQKKKMGKSPSISVPYEFLCPITLEIMTDPVIVASGQTYERESIQKWLDSSGTTCPKTGQSLSHKSLAPNFALRTIIGQWREANGLPPPPEEARAAGPGDRPAELLTDATSLIGDLCSPRLDVQRAAVVKIRTLTKDTPENRGLVARNGGIGPLTRLLSYPDSTIREQAVTALLNLSLDGPNKRVLAREGAVPAIVDVLSAEGGGVGTEENSAAALFSLSMLDENRPEIGAAGGIPPLVRLLRRGTIRGRRDALAALFNLSLCPSNKARAVAAGAVLPLLGLLEDRAAGMVDQALSILHVLATHPGGRAELGRVEVVERLVGILKEGSPKNKECAASLLLELGSSRHDLVAAAKSLGAYEPVAEMVKNGTSRSRRKAGSLLLLMQPRETVY